MCALECFYLSFRSASVASEPGIHERSLVTWIPGPPLRSDPE
jgi:hypothetical protein